MKDSRAHQNFQIQYPYFIFQVSQQQEEPTDLEKSMKFMIQSQNDYIQTQADCLQSINRLEVNVGPKAHHSSFDED